MSQLIRDWAITRSSSFPEPTRIRSVLNSDGTTDVEGFTPSSDILDFSQLLLAAGLSVSDVTPNVQAYVNIGQEGGNTSVMFDPSGHGGGNVVAGTSRGWQYDNFCWQHDLRGCHMFRSWLGLAALCVRPRNLQGSVRFAEARPVAPPMSAVSRRWCTHSRGW